MKKSINFLVIFILCFWSTSCTSQNQMISKVKDENCGQLDRHMIDYYRDTLLVDYVSRTHPELKQYITSKEDLIQLKILSCTDTSVRIYDIISEQEINIEVGKSLINLNDHKLTYVEITENDPKFIETVDGSPAYGLFSSELEVQAINKINIQIGNKQIGVPIEAYSNLFFPNFCNTFKSIRPLSAYKSEDEQLFFIYLYGANGLNEETSELRDVRSFLAKLVFHIEKGYIGRIVLRNTELNAYQWDCLQFKGI
ncbi:MAG: hypothetical protein WA004_05555 [Saprospiraceae bacterium]